MHLSCVPLSAFGALSQGPMTLADGVDFAVGLGLDGIACGPLLVKPWELATPTEVRRLAEACSVAIGNYTG